MRLPLEIRRVRRQPTVDQGLSLEALGFDSLMDADVTPCEALPFGSP